MSLINRFFEWLGLANNEDTSDFFVEKHTEFPSPKKKERLDLDAPNLFVGKIIDDGNVRCEVISCEENDFRIKILEINWPRLGTYMDLGETYPLLSCFNSKGMQVWEVDPEQMKRDTSQVLLAWEKQLGWTWDLDM